MTTPPGFETLMELARRHLAAREWRLAAQRFADAHRLQRAAASPRTGLGRVALAVGRSDAAIELLDAVLVEHPTCVEALVARAMVEDEAGRTEGALALYSRALELDPGSAEASAGAGLALARLGRWGESRQRLKVALPSLPEPGLMAAYAVASFHLGDAKEALAVLCHAIARDPNHVAALAALADILIALGDPATAAQLLENALVRRPSEARLRARREALA